MVKLFTPATLCFSLFLAAKGADCSTESEFALLPIDITLYHKLKSHLLINLYLLLSLYVALEAVQHAIFGLYLFQFFYFNVESNSLWMKLNKCNVMEEI